MYPIILTQQNVPGRIVTLYKSSFKGGREDQPHSDRVQTTKMELSDFV